MTRPLSSLALALTLGLMGSVTASAQAQSEAKLAEPAMNLWYDEPAKEWMTYALPIGNGELGAMFFGGVAQERIQFNEKTLWTGSPKIRGAYQNFGDLYLTFPHKGIHSNYRRGLSLDTAIGYTAYEVDGVQYRREYLASYPDKTIAIRLTTPHNVNQLSFSLRLQGAHGETSALKYNTIAFEGKFETISYGALLRVQTEGGQMHIEGDELRVEGANTATILLSASTNYEVKSPTYTQGDLNSIRSELSRRLSKASRLDYRELRRRHIEDYRRLYDRVGLHFFSPEPNYPTDVLLRKYRDNTYLDALYFQYGRYLMIASSRGMDLPNNLQGLWNDSNTPPWECDIHTNINIQMNYWPAETANLSECHMPFINYIAIEAGKEDNGWRNAAKAEGHPGWTMHTQSNIFSQTDWNINRPANAWYCMHLWQHYLYTQDKQYLVRTALPAMRSACEYWFDRLQTDDQGKLIAPKEWSPEHGPWEDGIAYAQQLIYELFASTLEASRVVTLDKAFTKTLEDKLSKLDRGLHIGSWGQIREWRVKEDKQGDEHRHLSLLMALYPGSQLSYHRDSTYAEAARVALASRGDNGTGWSRAWKISLWARLFDGDHAYTLLKSALNPTTHSKLSMTPGDGGVYPNLLDAHPPFQIDGNFGATAGIIEMLMQSNQGFIHLLPALPSAWPSGQIRGIKAEGNFTLDIDWSNALPREVTIISNSGKQCRVYYPNIELSSIKTQSGQSISYKREGKHIISFPTRTGERYTLLWKR